MADRFWVGGSANWDGTAGTKWATTSGGAGGASVPTSADDVYFDAASGAVTCTIAAGNTGARSINCTGFTGTLTHSSNISVAGSVTLVAAMTFNSSTQNFSFTGTATLTTAGKTFSAVQVNGAGITVTLADALTTNVNANISVVFGTFSTNNFSVTTRSLSSTGSSARTINLGSSTVTLSQDVDTSTSTNLTFNAGTSQINLSNSAPFILGSGQTFFGVAFTSTAAGTRTISGANTYTNLAVTGPASAGVVQVTFANPQTINGTLSTTGTAGNRRVWFRGVTYGIAQTLTINSAPSLTDADFRDIYVIGTAAPISGTRIGDLRGCRGITFSTPKTVYWNLAAGGNWSANAWAATSGGAVSTDNFPLAQDTAVIGNTGLNATAVVTMDSAISYTGTVDMSSRTTAMFFNLNVTVANIYGDFKNGSGTSYTSGNMLAFNGRNTQTITSAGISLNGPITIDSYGGTVQLADALNIGSNTFIFTNGTFTTNNFNVTAASLSSSNNNVRTINLGSSTVTLSGTTPTNFTTLNITLNAGTSSLICTTSNASQLSGGGQTFYDVSFTGTGSVVTTISQSNTFNSLSITAPASAGVRQISFEANQTITGALTVAGATAVRRIFLRSDTIGTTRTLTVNSLSAQDCDFRDITIAGAAAGSSPTRAGNCGGNTGITFPAPKTVYWNLAGTNSWTATAWASSSGGTPDINQFPLAQDTAVINDAGAVTQINNSAVNVGAIDFSARTTAVAFAFNASFNIHGNMTLSTAVTLSGGSGQLFTGRGTTSITSAGRVFLCPIIIDCATGTVQLADALTSFSLVLTSGTFDAVAYNVTATNNVSTSGAVASSVFRMGSGTWTLTGTGTVWSMGGLFTFFKGTSNIVLSNTGTSARTFSGNGFSYNKLTIGGATGTSTLTISGNNQFTELASTKTVAHTIDLGTTTQTFGAWTVTGTLGNVVTVTGTAALTIAGAAVSSVDYLALGTTTVSATSPGEFYAGANSTATGATAPLYLTAKPADSTRFWVGGTGNWSDTARWSTSSGGAGGASIPRSHDDVVFDNLSNATAYTATVNAVTGGIRCKALTVAGPLAGNLTLAGSTAIVGIHGNVTLPATGLTRTYAGAITLSGSATGRTITTNGVALESPTTVNGVGCEWTIGSAYNIGLNSITITNGLFATSTYNVTCGTINSTSTNKRTINFGSSTLTVQGDINFGATGSIAADLIVTAGTSQINLTGTGVAFSGNGKTFFNVAFTSPSVSLHAIGGINTFNNLSMAGRTGAGIAGLRIDANQTINGTLTLSAGTNATMRTFVQSDTIGTTRTLTCAAVASLTDIDFRDITIAGAAAPVSGTRLGDCKGNSGITFPAGKTVYPTGSFTSGNWGSGIWSTTQGGAQTTTDFPLAQDTVVVTSTVPTTGGTLSLNASYNIGTIDMSARTSNTMTLATSTNTPTIYGNWINGTGTTLSGTGTLTFAGRGSQTITSAGKTFTQPFIVNTPGGEVALQDSFVTSNNVTLTAGTFNATTYNVTLSGSGSSFLGNAATTKTIAVGSGTWTLAGSSVAWNAGTSAATTVTGTGTISLTSASAKSFTGGSISYSGITLDQGGAGTLTINGNNTFANITNSYKATGATNITLGTTTQRVGNFTASGEAGRVLTVQGTSASSPATLVFTGTGTATNSTVDYLAITGVRAYSLDTTWYAGANSTNNGSLGWYFEATPGGVITVFIIENATANSTEASLVTFNASASELAAGSDSILGGLTYLGALSESATAADVNEAVTLILRAINESASAQDINSVVASAFNAAVAEIANSLDTTQSTASLFAAASESTTAMDTIASFGSLTGQVVELAVGLDEALVLASTFSAAASESAQAQDLLNAPGSIYSAATAEIAISNDSIVGAYLWNPIDDTQNPNWQNINNAQSVTWTTVPDTQTPGWVIIPTSND